jgi:DNA modification methylase
MKISEKFKNLIPPLTSEEFNQLEQNCIKDGILESIKTWQGTIIDGHNRYNIAVKNGLSFETKEINFNSESEVVEWIILLQLGRRNLTESQKSYLRGVRYENEKLKHGGERASTQNGNLIKTADKLANEYNVSKNTIIRDSEFSKGIDLIASVEPEKRFEILQETSELTKQEIQEFAKIPKQAENEIKKNVIIASEEEINKQIEIKANELVKAKLQTIEAQKEAKKVEKEKTLEIKKAENLQIHKKEIVNKPEIKLIDCIEYLNSFEDNSIDLLITDPPYSTDVSNIQEFAKWVNLAIKKVKKTGRLYICIGAYPIELHTYLDILLKQDKFVLDNPLIWSYKNTLGVTPKMKYNLNYQVILHLYSNESPELDISITNEMFNVMEINAPDGRIGNRFHTWQKPDELALRLIKHSTKENDLVVDCFACTGTFLLIASKMNRIAKGCDISKENLKIAEDRGCMIIG